MSYEQIQLSAGDVYSEGERELRLVNRRRNIAKTPNIHVNFITFGQEPTHNQVKTIR